jgi:hypothetical protein
VTHIAAPPSAEAVNPPSRASKTSTARTRIK